jgi:FKBP-type peptidyl-prolyl cis-trans isomerase (trigger factor)
MAKDQKPIDMQHEEEIAKDDVNTKLAKIENQQAQIVESLKDMVKFLQDMVKMDYEVEEDGKKVAKTGPLWKLIKAAKKIGSF